MKRKTITSILFFAIILNTLAFSISASGDAVGWYVKRNGTLRPQISKEQEIIEKYNGYYIDKKLTDTSENKVIYLTFDAGYENGNVERILNILKEKNVSAAFFVLNYLILKNTALVKRMADEGHLVCNHTKNHKDMTKLTQEEIKEDVLSVEKLYEEKTGYKMPKYFRFPEGRYNEPSLAVIDSLGYKTVFWSFAYADWDNEKQPPCDIAMKKILDNTHNGEVILLHPTSETNADILADLIDRWREMGYRFGTLDELVA